MSNPYFLREDDNGNYSSDKRFIKAMFHQWFFQKVQGYGLFIFKMSSSKLEKLVCDVVIMIVIRRKSRGKAKNTQFFTRKTITWQV